MDNLTLPKGTTVKVNGLPFVLAEDTPVGGVAENLELALAENKDDAEPETTLTEDSGINLEHE